ncbi:hypothetical protein QQ045_005823 [Rhodiola kirilowii]
MAAMKEPEWSPPMAYHRICVHHFQSNFNTKVKDSFLKKKLGKVAYAKKEYKFATEYEELMKLLKDRLDVRMWLRNMDVHLWSLAMDTGGMRWGSMTTNASESFNGVLKQDRDLPISALEAYDGLPNRPNPHFKRTKVGRNLTRRRCTEMCQRDVGQSRTQGEASSSQPPCRIQRCKLCHQTGHNRRSCPFTNAS